MDVRNLALENIWIIDSSSGICIFDWYAKQKDKMIDEQLVSGLLLAFKNFSSEAGLVDISAIEGIGKKLAYKTDDRFIVAGICHSRDYEPLVNRTLLDLLDKFRKKFKDLLSQGLTTDVTPFREFATDIEDTLEGSYSSRNMWTLTTGIIASIFIAAIVFVGYFFAIDAFLNVMSTDVANFVGLILILVGMLICGFIAGIVAGDRKLGMISGAVSIIPVIILLVLFFRDGWSSGGAVFPQMIFALLYFLLFGSMATLGGLLGGFVRESRNFFPPVESEEDEYEDDDEDIEE